MAPILYQVEATDTNFLASFSFLLLLCSNLALKSEKAMAAHSSTLAWKIPWTEEPGGLQSIRSRRVGHDWDFTFTFHLHALEKAMATHSSVLAWRIPGMAEPSGLPSMGLHRVRHDWSDLAAAAAALKWLWFKWEVVEALSLVCTGSVCW